jgi:hypothetical protein
MFRHEAVGDVRGRGLVQAVEMVECQASKNPAPALATQVRIYSQKNPEFRIFVKIEEGIFISTLLYSLLTPFKKKGGGPFLFPRHCKEAYKNCFQGLYSKSGFDYGMKRNFVCSWRRPNCRSQVIDLSLSALINY